MAEVEEVKDIPLVYPLLSVTFRTVQMVEGRPIDSSCEEIINMKLAGNDLTKKINVLLNEFRGYLKKVRESVDSQQGRDALQRTLDNHSQAPSRRSTDHPSLPVSEAESGQGTLSLDRPAELPDKASL